MSEPIRIVAALIRDAAGRVLLVRKRGTTTFMQPGGKREVGEDDGARGEKELDALTKRHVDAIDALLAHKENELLEV